MAKAKTPHWEFTRHFRRAGFGWKSQPAIQRVRQAVGEIKKVARRDPILGAEGAVLFLARVSPALEHVDSSSGAIGTAVNHAIEALVAVIARAPADAKTREGWLERLWDAHANDEIPYIERLGDLWGELCVSREIASAWADRLVRIVEMAWSPDPGRRGFFHGTTACFSALLRAGRHAEILALLEKAPFVFWPDRRIHRRDPRTCSEISWRPRPATRESGLPTALRDGGRGRLRRHVPRRAADQVTISARRTRAS